MDSSQNPPSPSGARRFSSPVQALFWWRMWMEMGGPKPGMDGWDHRGRAGPGGFPDSRWCDFLEITKALERLGPADLRVIRSYFDFGARRFSAWPLKNRWPKVCERFWTALPGEMKSPYRRFASSQVLRQMPE